MSREKFQRVNTKIDKNKKDIKAINDQLKQQKPRASVKPKSVSTSQVLTIRGYMNTKTSVFS